MSKTSKARLIEGHVGKTLIKLTIPMTFGIVAMVLFNLIDTYFVGRLGTLELAAISFTFPVVMIVGSLALGLGIGASAVISRAIGEGDWQQVKRLTTDSLVLSVLIVAGFVVVGLFTIEPVFTLLGADQQVIPLIKQYMLIWYPGMVFVVVPMVGNHAIRATGDTTIPSVIMLVAVVVNVTLDPLLIFGIGPFPRLELAGAALATVFARATTFTVSLLVLYYRDKMITFMIPAFKTILESWQKILYIALPTGGTNVIVPISVAIITRLVADYGAAAVAGFGVAGRVEMFSLTLILSFNSVIGPFVGQNWGARKYDRLKLGIRYGHQFVMVWGLIVLVILIIFGRSIAAIFNDNPLVISTALLYFWIVPWGYGFQGILMMSNTALNVLNKPLYSAALILLRTFVLYIPLAYLGSKLVGLWGIFAALVIANTITGILAFITLKHVLRAKSKERH